MTNNEIVQGVLEDMKYANAVTGTIEDMEQARIIAELDERYGELATMACLVGQSQTALVDYLMHWDHTPSYIKTWVQWGNSDVYGFDSVYGPAL